jgi:carbonyl reductase 1
MASLAFALSSPAPKFPDRRVALVTGANKGIGYEIAKKLLSHKEDNENDEGFAFCVLLGCRDETLGTAASERLASETGNSAVDVVQIDLVDEQSIRDAASYIRDTYGRCDVLINNAAVCYNDPTLYGKVPHTPFAEQAQVTIQTNFFGTQSLTRDLLPLLERSESPRLINIASSAGRLSILPSEDKRAAFSSDTLTLEELGGYLRDFVRAASDGTHAQEGWPNTGYGVSKVGIIAMTRVLAKQHAGKTMVNSVDPGYCATDQNNNQGIIPAERGAVTPYLLAILDEKEGFTGKHWYQEQEIQW